METRLCWQILEPRGPFTVEAALQNKQKKVSRVPFLGSDCIHNAFISKCGSFAAVTPRAHTTPAK